MSELDALLDGVFFGADAPAVKRSELDELVWNAFETPPANPMCSKTDPKFEKINNAKPAYFNILPPMCEPMSYPPSPRDASPP